MQQDHTEAQAALRESGGPSKEEIRLAQRFFSQIERMSTLLSGYPDGHPVVMQSAGNAHDALLEYFELNDRLTVQVDPHEMILLGSDTVVWQTEDPRDFCFMLSRDGIFLVHLLAGVDRNELRRFIEILNRLIDPANLHVDAVTELFEANFSYIAYEALDESLAALAGVEADIRDRDTVEEREMIQELFNEAVKEVRASADGQKVNSMERHFQLRMQMREERRLRLEVGSRQFLQLSEDAQAHLRALRLGFTEHRELEHREGEILASLLGAQPREQLARDCVLQIGEVMGELVQGEQPWEALQFLRIIHAWRDRFAPQIMEDLKTVVRDCFTHARLNALVKTVASGPKTQRRAVLQMLDALHLNKAALNLVSVLGWELAADARQDIMAYIRKQAGANPAFLTEALASAPDSQVDAILELLFSYMPQTRPVLIEQMRTPRKPASRRLVLEQLRGTWQDPGEVRDILLPLLTETDFDLQLEAMRQFCAAVPQHVPRVITPLIDNRLRKRSEEHVREIVGLFVAYGGPDAVQHLDSLIRRRGVVGASEQELAVEIARALIRSPQPQVIELLQSIAGDWLVAKRIRGVCKEVVDLLTR